MRSYLRKQRVKIGNGTSEWADILKGVPQCSILGPILFNIFLNDMFKFIRKAELVSYANDNTINAIESSQQLVVQTLQIESKAAINWFTLNEMLASEWADILKGVPQGSILWPILFNIFLNDMFKFIRKAELVNYADDNTINAIESSQQLVVQTLQIESKAAINWFTLNEMLANPHKFQAIFLASADMELKLEIDDITLVAEDYVKLLGVNLDINPNYDTHIKQICKKAGNHFNALNDSHHISVSTIEWQYFAVSYCVISSSVALCGIFVEWGTLKR